MNDQPSRILYTREQSAVPLVGDWIVVRGRTDTKDLCLALEKSTLHVTLQMHALWQIARRLRLVQVQII